MSTLDRRWRDTFSTSNNFAVKIWTKRSAQKMILSPRRHWSFVRLYLQHCHSHSEGRSRYNVTYRYTKDSKDCAPELKSFHLLLLGGDAGDEAKKVFGVLQLGSIQRSIFEFPVSHFYRIVAAVLARLHGNCAEKYRSCLATQQSGFLEHEQSCISAPSYRWIDTTLCCSAQGSLRREQLTTLNYWILIEMSIL